MHIRKTLLLAVLVPALVHAQRAGTIELGAFGHYSFLDDDVLLGKHSVGAGGRLGFFALRYLSLEAEYSFGTINDNIRGVDAWTPFRGYVIGHVSLAPKTRLFLGAGYKQDRWVNDTTHNEFEDAFTAIVGVRQCFGKWSVRPELVYDQNPSPNFQTPVTEDSRYFSVRVGISRFFGRGSGSCGGPPPAAISVNLLANPTMVAVNGRTMLTWTSMNARSCNAMRPSNWTAKTDANGNESVQVATETAYWIMCRGPGGRDSASATVSIGGPQVTLTANPATVGPNEPATLTWTSRYATRCSAQTPANWATSTDTNGTAVVRPTQTTMYTIACTNGSAQATSSATVTVRAAAPTVTLSGGGTIDEGGSATLSWTSTNASSCATQSPPNWAGSSATSGDRTVSPGQNTTYTIQCSGPGGNSNTASATVEVRIRPRIISILGAALFRFDSSSVDPARASKDPVVRAAIDSLDMLADRMNNAPTANVVFVGNTDYVGTTAYNDALSERRARNAFAYLRSRVTDQSKLANTIVWACGENNADQTPPRPPEAEKGRFVDRNVTVYVNQPESVVKAPNCRRITP